MQLCVANTYTAMSSAAAHVMAELLQAHPEANIIVPTGETPRGFYDELAGLYRQGAFDASRVRVFQLDEYVGIRPEEPYSFYGWIQRVFLDPLNIDASRVVRLRGEAVDLFAACREYDAALGAAGGADMVVLGLGRSGHLGFNEPPADDTSPKRVVRLSVETRESNVRYWDHHAIVPSHALTCGMANILTARRKLLLVSGAHKRAILRRVVAGPVTPLAPASYLQESDHVTVLADVAAWPWSQSLSIGDTTCARSLTIQWRT